MGKQTLKKINIMNTKRMIMAVATGLMLLASCGTKTNTEPELDTVCLSETPADTLSVWP